MRAGTIHRFPPILVMVAVIAALVAAPSAEAAFGPIQLISKNSSEQAAYSAEPVVSADGRYVAFCAEFGGKEGVFRKQLDTGQVVPVAAGPMEFSLSCGAEPSDPPPYAKAPSISADGRYVSFETHQALTEGDTDEAGDVYVADMDSSPPTFRLVSAANGGEAPLPGGSVAAGGAAISADGNRVAFVNEGNVYVRELSTERTILVSARREPSGAMTTEPVIGGGAYELAGAAISSDGSTVAWVGEHLPEQVPLLADEKAAIEKDETALGSQYHEPLWRRVPDSDAEAPATRRIVGGGDPAAPGCPATGTLEEIACQGPYPDAASNHRDERIGQENDYGWGLRLPGLDADGDKVALVGDPDEQYDLFVVDMAEGLNRHEAVDQITQWVNPAPQKIATGTSLSEILRGGSVGEYLPFVGEVAECVISPDGTRVAFTTKRQHFSTAPFALVTGIPPTVSRLSELYVADLEAETIERITPGAGQNVSEALNALAEGATAPSFGEGDRLIAFASGADNLVAGDANEGTDVFTIESPPVAPVGRSTVSSPPPGTAIPPGWRMTANAFSRPDGEIRVVARVPAAGTLRVAARAQVGSRLKSLRVASGRRRSRAASVVSLDLKLGRGRRALARKPGLVTRINVVFASHGGTPLHVDLQGRFVVHPKRPTKHGKAAVK